MRALLDPTHALTRGLAQLRVRYQVPDAFPAPVLAAAEAAAQRRPTEHVDRTDQPFVTLDPAGATDLDQAFDITRSGEDLLLHYAIADVAWFVDDGGVIDAEAWRRGATLYLPDGKARLYPPVLSEGAASLLPDGPRPAVIFTVRVAPDGVVRLDGAERAVIRSRAKLAYETATPAELPEGFVELSGRIQAAEARRGATRVDPPEQEVAQLSDGGFELRFRPKTPVEDQNASLSLASNLAVATVLQAQHTGLFRVMGEPDEHAVRRLRHTAKAFGLKWPRSMPLTEFQRGLQPADPKQAAFMLAVRRAGVRASYAPYRAETPPWHSAVAAAYVHATAPLRRLADRYVVSTALAVANGRPPPDAAVAAFEKLPEVMARADAFAGQLDRAVIDLAESVMLSGREGERFDAVVTDLDERGARIQLCQMPVVARVAAPGAQIGEALQVELTRADAEQAAIAFRRAD